MTTRDSLAVHCLHLCTLTGFAVAQPLFSLLGDHGAFFTAHDATPADVVGLAAILSLGLPASIIAVALALGVLGRRVRLLARYAAVGVLVALSLLPPLHRGLHLPDAAALIGAGLLGGGAGVAYARLRATRLFVTYLSPAILIFPAWFLLGSPVSRIVLPSAVELGAATVRAPVPVVLVVFDEIPTSALMDAERLVDERRYPGFAALARDATWFRNATTVSDATLTAIPAILTGNYPGDRRLPTAHDHPRNLFTLLAPTYDLRVLEPVTALCPHTVCGEEAEPFPARLRLLVTDAAIAYLHALLPPGLRGGLPDISQRWAGFGSPEDRVSSGSRSADPHERFEADWDVAGRLRDTPQQGRARAFRDFVAAIEPGARPGLFFVHSLLPHSPYQFLPSGTVYMDSMPREGDHGWATVYTAARAEQRYLLQLAFVDGLLGELLARLRSIDLYDPALVIVTADHGSCFRRGERHRALTATNAEAILPVPLFVKRPRQRDARISDRNVETIDILPMIAEVLGIDVPWAMDGRPPGAGPERQGKTAFHGWTSQSFPSELPGRDRSLEQRLMRFGARTSPAGLFAIGPYRELLDRPLQELELGPPAPHGVTLRYPNRYQRVEPGATVVPASVVRGHLDLAPGIPAPAALAIAVNGIVRAVVPPADPADGRAEFTAIVPATAFRPGRNAIGVVVVERDEDGLRLRAAGEGTLP